jgi:dGTP triphosphohydrolase
VGIKISLLLCLSMFLSFAALAQQPSQPPQEPQEQPQEQPQVQPQEPAQEINENITDADLVTFVDVYVQVVEMQQEIEMAMMQAIEEENIAIERFNEILQARQNQQSAEEINASAEEMASFNNAAQKIMSVQQEAQVQMQEVIEEELGLEKYEQIVLAYQQSPEVQEKVNNILQQKMEQEGMEQGNVGGGEGE